MLREDPITGEVRLMAPQRAERLSTPTRGCPFCAGHEADTPQETGRRSPREGGPADAPWGARSFPNRWPLTELHEVVVPTPRHVTAWRELSLPELQDGLSLLLERCAALRAPGHYVHAFVNDGVEAGASISHAHAQVVVVGRDAHTDRLVARVRDPQHCALCTLLDTTPELLVERGRHHAIAAHPVPRMGGGLLVFPLVHDTDPTDDHVAELAELVRRAIAATPPDAALNLWLVCDPERHAHWYLEVQPRTANLAGVELALGLAVSAADPAATAASARERLAMPR